MCVNNTNVSNLLIQGQWYNTSEVLSTDCVRTEDAWEETDAAAAALAAASASTTGTVAALIAGGN